MNLFQMIMMLYKGGSTMLQVVKKLRDDEYNIPYAEIKQVYNKVLKELQGGKK